jgi:hypothetical protein
MNTKIPPYAILNPPSDLPKLEPEFVVWLDATLPKTHRVPVHPETGKVWTERAQRLCWLDICLSYENENEPGNEWEVERNALMASTEFREQPLFMETHLLMGPAFAGVVVTRTFSCHPETWKEVWETMTEAARSRVQVRTEQEWRIDL